MQTALFTVRMRFQAGVNKHYAARAVTGHSTSSEKVAEAVNTDPKIEVSPRTVRWHAAKLGLAFIKHSLPELVEALKKTPDAAS